MKFLKSSAWIIYWMIIAVILINELMIIYMDFVYRRYQTLSVVNLEKAELFKQENNWYQEKIAEARKLFKNEPKIYDPPFIVMRGYNYYRASYNSRLKYIFISEGMAADFDLLELAAVMSHEIAHAEEIEAKGSDDRPHWEVDRRAAELTDPRWVKSSLLKLVRPLCYADIELKPLRSFLSRHKFVFWPALFVSRWDKVKTELEVRIEYIKRLNS